MGNLLLEIGSFFNLFYVVPTEHVVRKMDGFPITESKM